MEHMLITYLDSNALMRALGCFDNRVLWSTLNGLRSGSARYKPQSRGSFSVFHVLSLAHFSELGGGSPGFFFIDLKAILVLKHT